MKVGEPTYSELAEQLDSVQGQYEEAIMRLRDLKHYGRALARSGNPARSSVGEDILKLVGVK